MGISLHRNPLWKPGGGGGYWEIWEIVEGEPCKRNISPCGGCITGTWRESSLTGDPDEYVEKGSGNGHLSSLGSMLGNLEWVHLPGTLGDGCRRSLNTEQLSQRALLGELGGRAPIMRTPKDIKKVRLWKWAFVSMGASFWGTCGDAPILGPLRERWNFFLLELLSRNSSDM
jgi:hypothetical protein